MEEVYRSESKQFFEEIYKKNIWKDQSSRSGTGSNMEQTEKIRIHFQEILGLYEIKSLLDIPCGDFFWMKEIQNNLRIKLTTYVGGDIVEELIIKNNEYYSDATFSFKLLDIQASALPKSDLVFCRDCLVHFSYGDIYKSLINIKRSNSRYFLATTFPGRINRDIKTGAWRPIDLQKFPFYFPKPNLIYQESCSEFKNQFSDKSLALWKIKNLGLSKFRIFLFLISVYRKIILMIIRVKSIY